MEFNEKTFTSQANFHLAGIVPIAGNRVDLDFPFPNVMLPIANNYTLLDAALVECAYAGCDTIWIICNDDTEPILRYRVGDYIEDPAYYYYNTSKNPDHRKRIPIFWVPQHPKDRDKRDCLSWSVIYGALSAFKVCSGISKWMHPDKYYVSYPYGISDPLAVMRFRKHYRTNKNFYMCHHSKTVQDNLYTSFTFGKDEFLKYRRNVRQGTGHYHGEYGNMEKLALEDRWSARFFELKDVFKNLDLDDASVMEVDNFYNVSSWEEYRALIGSSDCSFINKPPKDLFSYKEFNRVAAN